MNAMFAPMMEEKKKRECNCFTMNACIALRDLSGSEFQGGTRLLLQFVRYVQYQGAFPGGSPNNFGFSGIYNVVPACSTFLVSKVDNTVATKY